MYEYPFGNGQQLNLDWFLNEWKNLLAAWEAEKNGIEGALQAEIDRAEAALADVFAARDAAAQSAANALESKNAAAQSASDASGYLATVRADANTASNAAQNAAQSESNAAESAQTALASKNNAANSERNAAQSEQNALGYKNAAAQSASDANASKSAAAQSAEDANASKSAAAQSAEDASDAAASVEASAQQITTNANDISNLKESTNHKAGLLNAQFDKYGSRTAQQGNNQSMLTVAGNYFHIFPTSETPSESPVDVFYCPYNPNAPMQTTIASFISNGIIPQNAFIILPNNVNSLTFSFQTIKHNKGASYGNPQIAVFNDSNEVIERKTIAFPTIQSNVPDYFYNLKQTYTPDNFQNLFTYKKFAIIFNRPWPFYDFEAIIEIGEATADTNALALALENH